MYQADCLQQLVGVAELKPTTRDVAPLAGTTSGAVTIPILAVNASGARYQTVCRMFPLLVDICRENLRQTPSSAGAFQTPQIPQQTVGWTRAR